jgi:uncharacterized protein YjbI with pentapeptide repeats
VQFLGGPRDIREGGLGVLLRAVAWISLVIGPVLLLLLLQAQFLPYHLEWVTWVQRVALLADVILLWLLWPAVLASRSDIQVPRPWGSPALAFLAFLSLSPISLAFFVARFPGEWIDQHISDKQWIPANPVTALLGATDYSGKAKKSSFHDLLFNGEVDQVTRRRKSLFSNTLVLPSFDALEAAKIDDQKKLDSDNIKQSSVLRGRHLEGAVLTWADLRKADLEGAHLQNAQLGAANMQGASLDGAQLQGAFLNQAQLQGASLYMAQLQGAYLASAQLQGASLLWVQAQGAVLSTANLDGASLIWANLEGASFDGAQLGGANLGSADLQGANLEFAYLAGANLENANLSVVDMEANIWRANFNYSFSSRGKLLRNLLLTNLLASVSESQGPTTKDFTMFKEKTAKVVPLFEAVKRSERLIEEHDLNPRQRALNRIEILNPDIFGPELSHQVLLERARVDQRTYEAALEAQLKGLVCSLDENTAFIVRGLGQSFAPELLLFNRTRITATGTQAPALVEAILSPKCPVSAALTENDKMELRKISAYQMRDLVCQPGDNTLDMLHGFLQDGYIKGVGDQAPDLVQAILDCPVSAILSDADKAALQEIKKEAPAY